MSCACVRVDVNSVEPLENLLRFVMSNTPKLPYELAMDMLRQSYTEFARATNLLVSHYEVVTQKDVKDYLLSPPDGYEIYGLLKAPRDGENYIQYPNASTWFFSWGQRVRLVGNNLLVFYNAPSRDYDRHEVALHLLPTACAEVIPTEVSTPFGEGIAMGAVRRALEMPKQAWTDLPLAQLKRRDFSRAALIGRNLHIAGRSGTPLALMPIRIL